MQRRLLCFLLCFMLACPAALAEKTIRMTFTGDVTLGSEESKKNQSTSFVTKATEEGYAYFFAQVKELFSQDDLTVVNLEGPLTDKSTQENTKKYYRFRGPTDYVNILLEGSVEACNLANNHTYDFGKQGYESTQATLDAAGIGYFGQQTTYIYEKDGVKIAFFGLNSTQFNGNRNWARDEIARLKADEGVNAVVFVFHGGQEYGKKHNKNQETYAHFAIDAGADLVIMHHPHVVQGIEIYNNRTICYSLGNFCFGGNKDVRALEALVAGVTMTFSDSGEYLGQQVDLYPANISGTNPSNNFQPLFVTGEAAQTVMALVQKDTKFDLPEVDDTTGCAALPYLTATATDLGE